MAHQVGGDPIPCSAHIPESAIPGLMKVFPNLKSLQIRLRPYCSPSSGANFIPHVSRIELLLGSVMHAKWFMAYGIVTLSRTATDDDAALSMEIKEHESGISRRELMQDVATFAIGISFAEIARYLPKTLSRFVVWVLIRSKVPDQEERFLWGVNLDRLQDLILNSRSVNESWLKNPHNVDYWLKKLENEHWLEEKVWLVEEREDAMTVKDGCELKEILGAFDCEDDNEDWRETKKE